MPIWFIFSLFSIFVLAGSEISQKVSLTQKVNVSAITNNFFVWTLEGVIGLLLAAFLGQLSLNIDVPSLTKLVALGLVYFLGGTFFYSSYKGNSPSISIILGTISVVFSSVLGVIFLKDSFNIAKAIGVILILSAIAVLNFNKKEKFNKYNILAMLGGVFFGIAFTIDKSFVVGMSPFMYLGMMGLTVAIISLIFGTRTIVKESKMLVGRNFVPMAFSGFFASSFNLLTFFAYRFGANVGVADAINNSSIFVVILIEIFFLKDKTNLARKIASASVAVLGMTVVGLVR